MHHTARSGAALHCFLAYLRRRSDRSKSRRTARSRPRYSSRRTIFRRHLRIYTCFCIPFSSLFIYVTHTFFHFLSLVFFHSLSVCLSTCLSIVLCLPVSLSFSFPLSLHFAQKFKIYLLFAQNSSTSVPELLFLPPILIYLKCDYLPPYIMSTDNGSPDVPLTQWYSPFFYHYETKLHVKTSA